MEKEIYLFFISQIEKEIDFFPNKPSATNPRKIKQF